MSPQSAPCSTACCIMGTCSSAVRAVGVPRRQQRRLELPNDCSPTTRTAWHDQKTNRKKTLLTWGRRPHCPWDLSLSRQNGSFEGRLTPPPPFRPLGRRSGRIPAEPYLPPR